LVAEVKTICTAVLKKSQELAENSKRQPLVALDENGVATEVLPQLTDPGVLEYCGINERRKKWRCGFCGVMEQGASKGKIARLTRIVFVPPIDPETKPVVKKNLGPIAHLIDTSGRYELPFVSLKIIGDEPFIRLCNLQPAINDYVTNPDSYQNSFLTAEIEDIRGRFERLRLAVNAIVSEQREKASDPKLLRAEFEALGLPPSKAGDAARELMSKSGKRVLDLLEDTLCLSSDPLISAIRLMKYRSVFASSVPPPVLRYASEIFASRFGLLLVDGESVCLCSVSAALRLHEQLLITQGICDDSLQGVTATTPVFVSHARQRVLALTAIDFPEWASASALAQQLPIKPSPPPEPVDPYVREAQRRRGAEIAAHHAKSQAADRERLQELDYKKQMALANGDIEGFFEAGAALGAAAALQSNNAESAERWFGSAGRREAVEFARRRKQVESIHDAPLRVSRPEGYESTQEWRQFLRETAEYPSKLADYHEGVKAREDAIRRVAKTLEPSLRRKQSAALAEIDRLVELRAVQMRRAMRFLKSKGESVLVATGEEDTGCYIPSLPVLAKQCECIVAP